MYDKEISHYDVILYGHVDGKYKRIKTIKKYTEESAVSYAKEELHNNNNVKEVIVQQISNVIWW